jgi:phytochrome-interacting factor 4
VADISYHSLEDDGLMELLWCNGHVVMQSQAPRKPARSEKDLAAVQDDEAAAWFQYPIEDPLERDLFSELFGETPADPGLQARKAEEECAAVAVTAPQARLMPPPRKKACVEDVGVSECAAGGEGTAATEAGGESSMLTIGSSFCGSNHVQTTPRAAPPPRGGRGNNARGGDAATVTSSSMQQPRNCAAAHRSGKRKQRDATENEVRDTAGRVLFSSRNANSWHRINRPIR